MSTLNSVYDLTANRLMLFDCLPVATCNSPDFDPGGSINTAEPISYTSSNANVAVIIDGKICITGVGTSVITAAACDNLIYPAKKIKVTQLLTVQEPECIKPECRVVDFNKGITKVLKQHQKIKDMNHKQTNLSSLLKVLVAGILFLVCQQLKAQQQFSFTQYMDNLTPINANYSLLQPVGSIHTTVRKQWVGIPGAPSTYLINGSLPIESVNASAGLIAMNDSYTVEHQTEVDAFFAKAIKLSGQNSLAVSLNAGFRNYVANYSQVSSTDNSFKNDIRETTPNLGFGVMFYSDNYYIGVSAPELNTRTLGTASQQDDYDFKSNYYLCGGFASKLGDDFKFKYAGLVSYTQGVPLIADVSAIAMVKEQVGFGVNVRTNKEVAGIFSVNYDVFHIGYSYQFGTSSSNIGGFSNATQEITLGINFGKKAR